LESEQNRRHWLKNLGAWFVGAGALSVTAEATSKPPKCCSNCPTPPVFKLHWDGEIFINGIGYLPELREEDLTISIPGVRLNDELWYYKRYDAMVFIDYNHSSGVPHVIIFGRGGEFSTQGPWFRMVGVGVRLVSYIGNRKMDDGSIRIHHCLVDLDRTIQGARNRNRIYLDWTPLTAFTTYGAIPPLNDE